MSVSVMLVDDEEDIRTLMRVLIETSGRDIEICAEAHDGIEALDRFDQTHPEVVVLDERMPGPTGIATAEQMRVRRPSQHIILCSAYLDPALRRRAEAAGIEVCLAKGEIGMIPATIDDLANAHE